MRARRPHIWAHPARSLTTGRPFVEVGLTVSKTCSCFFVQPNVLEHMVRTGTPEQRDIALATLGRDHSIRAVRLQNALLSDFFQLRSRSLVEPTPGVMKRVIFDAEHSENAESTKVVWGEGDKPVAD